MVAARVEKATRRPIAVMHGDRRWALQNVVVGHNRPRHQPNHRLGAIQVEVGRLVRHPAVRIHHQDHLTVLNPSRAPVEVLSHVRLRHRARDHPIPVNGNTRMESRRPRANCKPVSLIHSICRFNFLGFFKQFFYLKINLT